MPNDASSDEQPTGAFQFTRTSRREDEIVDANDEDIEQVNHANEDCSHTATVPAATNVHDSPFAVDAPSDAPAEQSSRGSSSEERARLDHRTESAELRGRISNARSLELDVDIALGSRESLQATHEHLQRLVAGASMFRCVVEPPVVSCERLVRVCMVSDCNSFCVCRQSIFLA